MKGERAIISLLLLTVRRGSKRLQNVQPSCTNVVWGGGSRTRLLDFRGSQELRVTHADADGDV